MCTAAPRMYNRVRSFSCSSLPHLLSTTTSSSWSSSPPVRQMHGSILHPRAPKIRHLNASHTLLMDMDMHIQKVQELENKVIELERQLQLREAKKAAATAANKQASSSNSSSLFICTELSDKRLRQPSGVGLVSEAEQAAFQQRLQEARRRAEQLAARRLEEEANILRSWHSKRLRQALESLLTVSDPEKSPKLLASPDQRAIEDSRIFSSLDTIVELANSEDNLNKLPVVMMGEEAAEQSYEQAVEKLKNLIVEKENVKHYLEAVRSKQHKAADTCEQCLAVLSHVQASRRQLQSDIAVCPTVLDSLRSSQRQRTASVSSSSSLLWVFGPNPIFLAADRELELDRALKNQFVVAMQQKLDISQIHAEINLSTARHLVNKYSARAAHLSDQLEAAKAAIERQIRRLTALRSPTDQPLLPPAEQLSSEVAKTSSAERFLSAPERTPREI